MAGEAVPIRVGVLEEDNWPMMPYPAARWITLTRISQCWSNTVNFSTLCRSINLLGRAVILGEDVKERVTAVLFTVENLTMTCRSHLVF